MDSTLRDGEQALGISFSDGQKLRIADALDSSGIHEIEAGVPALSKREKHLIARMMEYRRTALISVWTRLVVSDIQHCLDVQPSVINLSLPISRLQIYAKLRKDEDWLIGQLKLCLELIAKHQVALSIGFEDAFRAELPLMLAVVRILRDFGVVRIRLSDTVGIATPSLCRSLVAQLGSELGGSGLAGGGGTGGGAPLGGAPPSGNTLAGNTSLPNGITLGFHGHNDLGMAVANTVEAAKSGCLYADVTVGGIGERAGNCDLAKLLESSSAIFDWGMTADDAEQLQQQIGEIAQLAKATGPSPQGRQSR